MTVRSLTEDIALAREPLDSHLAVVNAQLARTPSNSADHARLTAESARYTAQVQSITNELAVLASFTDDTPIPPFDWFYGFPPNQETFPVDRALQPYATPPGNCIRPMLADRFIQAGHDLEAANARGDTSEAARLTDTRRDLTRAFNGLGGWTNVGFPWNQTVPTLPNPVPPLPAARAQASYARTLPSRQVYDVAVARDAQAHASWNRVDAYVKANSTDGIWRDPARNIPEHAALGAKAWLDMVMAYLYPRIEFLVLSNQVSAILDSLQHLPPWLRELVDVPEDLGLEWPSEAQFNVGLDENGNELHGDALLASLRAAGIEVAGAAEDTEVAAVDNRTGATSDNKNLALSQEGHGAATSDAVVQWLRTELGVTGGQVNDLWMAFLSAVQPPLTPGNIVDMQFEWLGRQGYTGDINSRWNQYWFARSAPPPSAETLEQEHSHG